MAPNPPKKAKNTQQTAQSNAVKSVPQAAQPKNPPKGTQKVPDAAQSKNPPKSGPNVPQIAQSKSANPPKKTQVAPAPKPAVVKKIVTQVSNHIFQLKL